MGRSSLRTLLTATWGGFPQGWGFRCVVHFANRHAYVKFWLIVDRQPTIQSLTSHTDIPFEKVWHCDFEVYVCVRHRHRGVEWMDGMRHKTWTFLVSSLCSHGNHMISLVTVLDFIFHFTVSSPMHCEALTMIQMAARTTAARARDSKRQSNHCRRRPNVNAALKIIIIWCVGVRYKSDEAFVLWSEWH